MADRPLAFVLVAWALLLPACSLVLSDGPTQCQDDSECARFPSAICDRSAGVCTPMTRGDAAVTGGAAGSGTGGRPAAPDSGTDGPGGATVAGSGGAGGADAGRCPDLDANGVPDCQESLVPNADFATGISGWTPEVGVSVSFSSADAGGDAHSGSLVLNNAAPWDGSAGLTLAGVSMCLPNTTSSAYDVYLQVAPAPSADGFAQAGIAVSYFPSRDCSGAPGGMAPTTALDQSVAGWRLIQQILQPSVGTNSMLVRLIVAKQATEVAAKGSFDNLLIRAR